MKKYLVPCDVEISILLPAYNEAPRMEHCLREVETAVKKFTRSYEIVVVEDGSIDRTADIVAALSKKDDRLRLLHSINRLGKGKAVKRGIESAKGDTIVFMDVDLSANLKSLSEIVRLANVTKGLVIGSRHIKGSRVRRSLIRTISSLTYNLIVRLVFQDGVRDHQCGFKAMNREVAEFLRKNARAEGFFLDTEMVLLCRIHDIRVTEVAVDWTEVRKRKSQGVRLFKDATKLGFDLLRFRLAHLNLRLPKQSGV